MKKASKWLKSTLFDLQKLIQTERRIGVQILDLLAEIESRKAYSELGYDGLFSFCVRELKFTESQAFQRIQAMRALKTIPEVREKMESGSMSVTTISQVQVFLRQEKAHGIQRDVQDAKALMQQFENKTSKEVKVQLAELKGEIVKSKLTIELDSEGEELWALVRGQSAHSTGGNDLRCLKMLMREWLDARSKVQAVAPSARGSEPKFRRNVSGLKQVKLDSHKLNAVNSRYIPVRVRSEIFKRDQNKCTNCGSIYALQVDHKIPFAKNGTNDVANLQLLCRNCNLNRGVREFGKGAMQRV